MLIFSIRYISQTIENWLVKLLSRGNIKQSETTTGNLQLLQQSLPNVLWHKYTKN